MDELKLQELPRVFDSCLSYWHGDPADFRFAGVDINVKALELAYRNYLLWHEEDKARRTDVDDAVIASVKRSIDKLNQQRNDMIEKLDEEILEWVETRKKPGVTEEINSETPGSIVDRISILSLKIYHMDEDCARNDIGEAHRSNSQQKLAVLKMQREDLYHALVRLMSEYLNGHKQMKLYKQFKMYNDPLLNPELYKRG